MKVSQRRFVFMKKTDVTITIEVETDVVKKAEALFHELGLDMNTATTIFLRQCIRNNGIPFKIGLSTEISDKLSSLSKQVEQLQESIAEIETLYLTSIPGMKEKLIAGMKTPLSKCFSEKEVESLFEQNFQKKQNEEHLAMIDRGVEQPEAGLGQEHNLIETEEAINEVQQMKADPTLGKTYADVDTMMKDLLA